MFKVNEWVKENLIRGYEKGVFAGEYAAVLAAGFFAKGVLSHDDLPRRCGGNRPGHTGKPNRAGGNSMIEAIIAGGASVLVGALSLIGVILTNSRANSKMQNEMKTAQAVTDERLEARDRGKAQGHKSPLIGFRGFS